MRLPLTTLEVFTAIARQGSLRGAAESLGVKPSTVSHQLKSLEEQVGTALFIRTTRSVNMTEAGRALFRGTGPAFEQIVEAIETASTTGHAERGSLKLAMPEFAYHMLVSPALPSFCQMYPEIEVELSITDAFSDILGEELHAGFRLGDRIAEDMVAVRLTPPQPLLVAANPDYLNERGTPSTPRDLLEHNCIRYRFQTSGRIAPWEFSGQDGTYNIEPRGNLTASTLPVLVDLAKRGLGLIYTFRDYCPSELSSGTLISVLQDHLADTPGIYIYFPREYRSMTPLRLFIDHLHSASRDSVS